jgi:hypothetical protein
MAAGLGFKTFVTGEVLTAGDTNGYLMQGINVFATTAARDAAITAPAEGQFAFTKDTNSLWYYDGAAWVASGATGDIEGVTAGIGISGGGTSGTVTVTNSMATAIDAKGDLVAGTGADAFSRLGVGANDTVLTADSAEATGLKWATASSGGMTQLATGTLSGATTSITGISGSYKNLQVIVRNFDPTSDGSGLGIRLNQDATASRNTTGSNYGQTQGGSFASTLITVTADVDNSVNQGLIMINIYDYANATTWKMLDFLSTANNPTTTTLFENRVGYGVYNQTAAISSFDFIVSGGAAGGTYFVYGVK